ncbi:MAG TPA: hypothetical protein VMM12_07905 [Longimicrobiales bacterium]|nr:hypothetical protein [Longimicrobiales bacterium]
MTLPTEIAVLRDVIERFERLGLEYMLTGSLALSYYAEPRMTRDLDFVVALSAADAPMIEHVRKHTPYRLHEFERRRAITVAGVRVWIVSKEDLMISKLDWARDSRSEVQLRDVRTWPPRGTIAPTWTIGSSSSDSRTSGRKLMKGDTTPAAARIMRERWLALRPERRLVLAARMFDSARALVLSSFPEGLPEEDLKTRLCARLYGEDLSQRYNAALRSSVRGDAAP